MPEEVKQKQQVFMDVMVEKPVILDSPEKDGKLRLRFKATQANVVNSNRRMYPRDVLQDAIQRSNKLIADNRMVGESPHPKHYIGVDGSVVFDTKFENSAIKIYNQFMDDNGAVYVDAVVMDTPQGRAIKAHVDEGIPVGISMRALGDSVRKQINGVMIDVATRLEIGAYDPVRNPATEGSESVEVLTDSQVEAIMTDDVQITTPNCPDCGTLLQPQDPDGDNDLDFYSCPSCQEVFLPDEEKRVSVVASQTLRKLPNDPDFDGYQLARQFKAGMKNGGMTDSLSAKERDNLKDSDFAVPGKRKLPIHDAKHVKMAWDMLSKTQGLTSEEKAEAKKRILAAAKRLGVDTSDWNKSMTDQKEAEQVDIQEILKAMKDSPELQAMIDTAAEAKAKAIAQPALDHMEKQRTAEEAAKAKADQKAEAKTFVDSRLTELKGSVHEKAVELIREKVANVETKEQAALMIDSLVSVYSDKASQAMLDAMGYVPGQEQPQGQTRVEVGFEHKPWAKHMKAMADSMDREKISRGENIDPSIRKVNQPLIDKMIEHAEKNAVLFDGSGNVVKRGYEAMADSATFLDSQVFADSTSITTGQVLNQPTISALLLQQTFQDVESAQFLHTETFQGSEVRFMSEFYNSVATVNPATGIIDIQVAEGNGIPESGLTTTWITFNPVWRRNAVSMSTDVINTMLSGPAKYDVLSRGIFHISQEKRRIFDNYAYYEMVQSSDEYQPTAVSNETPSASGSSAGQITNSGVSGNVAWKYNLTVGGAANSTVGTNPVVRPRTKKQTGPSGQVSTVTSNAFTVTVSGTTLTMGYLDANGSIQSGDYAVDFENGVVYFASSANLNPTAATPVMPVISYHAATNYDRWSKTIGSGYTKTEDWTNTLLTKITTTAAAMGSAPRYKRPNVAIMSLNTAAMIQNASMWYKLNDPVVGQLSGLAASTNFGSRSNVNFAQINAPWVGGDGRILMTQKGATKYAVETPYQIEGPFPKYDASGNIIDSKVFYGRENSVFCTPLNVDDSGNIINPVARTLKITN